MNVSAASSLPATMPLPSASAAGTAVETLKMANEMQGALFEKLLSSMVANLEVAQKMEIAGQILDTYA